MATITIYASSNSNQTGIEITDQTDWAGLGVSRSVLDDITISVYGSSLSTPSYPVYTMTELQEAAFIADGFVEILFTDLVGLININDGWWTIRISANTGTYVSNYSGFGIYADITYAVWSKINGLHVPEEDKFDAQKYCQYAMFLKGLGYLDTTNVSSREIKFNKRLLALQKMILNI